VFQGALAGIAAVVGAVAWMTRLHSSVTVDPPRSAPAESVETVESDRPAPTSRRRLLRRPRGRTRRILLVAAALLATLAVTGGVIAFFSAGSNPGGGSAQAGTLDPGNEPTSVGDDRDVTVSWTQNSPAFLGGVLGNDPNDAGGYLVTRYADGDTNPIPAGDDCDGLRRGAADPLDCSESSLPTGRWQYTVTPKYYNWLGAASSKSVAAIVAPEAPDAVTLVNGGGVGSVWVNQANQDSLEVDVDLPGTSLDSDTVHLTISDGTSQVTADQPGTSGSGTATFTGLDVSGLDDGELTFAANVESSYGDLSDDTTASYDKDATSPTVVVSPDRSPDHNGWYNAAVTFSTAPGSFDNDSGLESCDDDLVYTAPDGSDLTVTLECLDKAGNTGSGTSGAFDFDDTNPIVDSVTPDRSPDHNGWYNAAVTWTAAGSDGTSGIDTCESLAYPGPDGADLTVTRTCTDVAGNSGSGSSPSFDFDDTNPSVTLTPGRGPDHNGWYNAPVLWTPSQTDATSGPDTCDAPVTYSTPDSATASVTRTCADQAGNVGSATATFQFDDTDPSVTLTPDRSPDHNGWYNAAVVWTPNQTDATSGPDTCQAAVNYTGPDSATASVTRTCADQAGNVGSATATFQFDDTDPVVNVLPLRSPDHNGWYNAPVTFSASTSTDATSGIDSCDANVTYSGPDGTGFSVSRTCTDNAGNSNSGTSALFKYDNTDPTVTLSLTAAGSASISGTTISYKANEAVAGNRTFRIRAAVADTTSGPASASFPAIATTGWTHAAEGPITTPSGGPYDSSAFTWVQNPAGNPTGYVVSFADDAGNPATQGVTFVNDSTAPTLTTLEMFDVNGNGKIDRVVATFNDALAACTTPCTSGWTLANVPSGGAISSVTVAGSAATVNISEGGGAPSTAVGTFTVALAATSGVQDVTSNHSSFAAQAPADKAAPARLTLEMFDNDTDGRIDRFVATFSENLAASSNTAQWTLASAPSGGTVASVSTSSAAATVLMNEGAGAEDTAVGAFTIALAANGTGIRDSAGNQSSFAAVAPADKAGPVAVSITDTDGVTNGRMESGDTLVVTFSEPIASSVAGSTVIEADPSGSPGPNDTLNIPGLTNGARPTGSDDYVTQNNQQVTCSGSTLAKSNGDKTITATVGATCSGTGNLGTNGTPTNFNYAPASTLTDAAGNPAAGSLIVLIRLF
jgi:hypothetical protein